MPLVNGGDQKGRYYKYGVKGHKYYYPAGNVVARKEAKKLAIRQGVAIGYRTGEKIESRHPKGGSILDVLAGLFS